MARGLDVRILVVTPQIPRFPGPGGEARQFCLLRELCSRHTFTVMPLVWAGSEHLLEFLRALPLAVDPIPAGETVQDGRKRETGVNSVRRRLRDRYPGLAAGYRSVTRAGGKLTEDLRILSPAPQRTAVTRAAGQAVRRKLGGIRLEAFDLIQVEHAHAGHWLSGLDIRIPKLLVCLDIDSLIARRRADLQTRFGHRLAAWVEWQKLRRYERQIAGIYGNCVTVSEEDRAALRSLAPAARTWVVPNGVDPAYFHRADPSREEAGSLVFTGTMFWEPNVDAMISFCADILPRIRRQHPKVRMTIVGAEPSQAVRGLAAHDGVIVTGTVEDVRPYIAAASVYVVPLRNGGGTRLKILEAMAMGKAVVSTSVGCEGLRVSKDRELVVADGSEALAEAVCRLLEDPAERQALGETARRAVMDRYDWRIIARQQDAVYTALAQDAPAG